MKKAQSLLDFILIFGILVGVTVGFTRIWVWFNANIAKRNVDYQNSRLEAGTATIDNSRSNSLVYEDKHLALNDDWIFRGKTSGTVGMPLPVSDGGITPITAGGNDPLAAVCASAKAAATSLRSQAANMDAQAEKIEDFVDKADDWYDPLFWVFLLLGIDIDSYKSAAASLRSGANNTRTQADSLENQACSAAPVNPYEGPQPWRPQPPD